MDYKKAEMIELHNSNVIIHTDDYSDGAMGWSEYPGENEEFYIEGDTLSNVLEMVGVTVEPVRDGRTALHMKSMEIPIRRRKVVVGGETDRESNHKIVGLEVKIENANLIHIRFVSEWEDSEKVMNCTQEVTYCGSYTVWWSFSEANVKEKGAGTPT